MYKSSKDFYTDGGYYQHNPDWHQEGSHAKAEMVLGFINQFTIPTNSVTEIGCGAGEILAELSRRLPAHTKFTGYDISPQAIELANKKTGPQLNFILAEHTAVPPSSTGLVLILDVIEHVDDMYSFLRDIRDTGSDFIFHIPLDMSCRTLLKPHVLLQQRKSVGHIHYLTEETVMWMLEDTGFEVRYFIYTKPDVDILAPRSFKQWVKKRLRAVSYSIHKKLSVKLWGGYSVLVLAKPIIK